MPSHIQRPGCCSKDRIESDWPQGPLVLKNEEGEPAEVKSSEILSQETPLPASLNLLER